MNDDLISREELKKAMYIQFDTSPYFKHIIDVIDSAPPVEQPTVEWIDVHSELDYYATLSFTCGKCGCEHQLYSGEYGWYYDDDNIPWDFCPKCGAKMKGGEGE